ncbi:AMP-binding protein [Streptomyces sp. NPDC057302]|uniref:AMP-binding protein n=1 Tax=Streptomyces sp. NPDC057302 TaxID=3346094 RepID=UPI00362E7629
MLPDVMTPTTTLAAGLLSRAGSDAAMVEILSSTGGPGTRHTYRELIGAARVFAAELRRRGEELGRPVRVGLLAENSAQWVVADLAALFARAVEIPVPTAFTPEQAASLLADADICLVDARGEQWLERAAAARAQVLPEGCPVIGVDLPGLVEAAGTAQLPPLAEEIAAAEAAADTVVKVVHTSGTTSAPKGVRVRLHGIEALLASLGGRVDDEVFARYLSVVPLSLLIEQVAGLYMPFLNGGSVTFLPPGTALIGTVADAGPRMLSLLRQAQPTAMVVPPTVAGLLLALCEQNPTEDLSRRRLRLFGHTGPVFIACGGAPVSLDVLRRLEAFGIPLYEGYGLSENSSVVAWNFPGQFRFGTVGRALDHVRARLADDGELLIRSTSLFAGYTQEDPSSVVVDAQGWLHTGDLATIDDDGYIRITGRKKSLVITAAGRNLSPEWVEARYRELGFVREAAIVADGLDEVLGLFVIDAGTDRAEAARQIREFGAGRLSAIERATSVRLMAEDDPEYTTCFTVTGRPRREAVRDLLTRTAPEEITA